MIKLTNSKNGGGHLLTDAFTLIELLAVIIILAIIALIATPIILDVVEDARKSAGKSEANMIYSGINNYCATEDVKYQMDNSYTKICTSSMTKENIPTMVNLGNAEILEIEYSDKLTWLKVKSNGHIYSLQDNAMVEGDLDKPEAAYAVGDLLKVQVSDSETQNIYVLEVNGNEIVGLLDRNLVKKTEWISEEDYNSAGGNWSSDSDEVKNQNLYEFGPVTALAALNERTSNWDKVNKVEMQKAKELLKLTEYYKKLESSGETANWESKYVNSLYEFVQVVGGKINCTHASECREKIIEAGFGDILLPECASINLEIIVSGNENFAYWTATPINYSFAPDMAWCVAFAGFISSDIPVNGSVNAGLRPVIHIDESNILEKLEASEYTNPEDGVGEK